jgi:plasmid stabilization system protein ParE
VFKVIVSPRAWRDFFEIFDYISADSPEAAERFCNALLNHTELLSAFPNIGAPATKFVGVRFLLHTPIRIYYRVDQQENTIEVIHFWHTSRRPPKL